MAEAHAGAGPSVGTDERTPAIGVVGTPTLDWAGTTVLEGDPVEAVRALKEQPGRDLLVQGSPGLLQTLLTAGLLDELRLAILPVMLGNGKRQFGGGIVPLALELAESSVSASGVVLALYRPAGDVKHGSWMLDPKDVSA